MSQFAGRVIFGDNGLAWKKVCGNSTWILFSGPEKIYTQNMSDVL